jgi:high-affinity Fe2+/Pb2+ permease
MRLLVFVVAALAVVAIGIYLATAYANPMYAILGLAAGLVVVILGLATMMVKRRSSGPPPPTN